MRAQVKRGFTLIEILIVVVILGILAAIVIPQFTDASTEAKTSSTKSMLQTIRSQVELYRVKTGVLPDLTANWDDLVVNNYLQAEPINPFANDSGVGAAAAGWIWSDLDGDGTTDDIQATDPDDLEGDGDGVFTNW